VVVCVITGPPGAGKSVVATALHDALGDDGIASALVELDELERSHPPLDRRRAMAHLEHLCRSFREAGHDLLIVTATIEDDDYATAVLGAVGPGRRLVARLEAEPATLERRITEREPQEWSGLGGLLDSARRLAATMPALTDVDLVVDTDVNDQVAAAAFVRDAVLGRR
jgi:hypothetical protein